MKPDEIAVYARGVEDLLDGKKDPQFTLMLIADVVGLGEHVRGPASVFAEKGGLPGEEVLVPCAGLRTLERMPRRPREPQTSDEYKLQRYAEEFATWCEAERRVNALLDLHKKRLRSLLSAAADDAWLRKHHPRVHATLPRGTSENLGKLIEAFGAGEADTSSSAAIWRYVHAWPANARLTRDVDVPWQDAGGWGE